MKDSKEIIIVRDTFRSTIPEGQKTILSEKFTDHVNSLIPEGYHYKEMIKYQDEHGEVDGIPMWRIEFAVVFEKNNFKN